MDIDAFEGAEAAALFDIIDFKGDDKLDKDDIIAEKIDKRQQKKSNDKFR